MLQNKRKNISISIIRLLSNTTYPTLNDKTQLAVCVGGGGGSTLKLVIATFRTDNPQVSIKLFLSILSIFIQNIQLPSILYE